MQEINTKVGVMVMDFLSRLQKNCTCANSGRHVPSFNFLLAEEPGIKPIPSWRGIIKLDHTLGWDLTII